MIVRWTPAAREDVFEQVRWIAEDDVRVSLDVLDRIERAVGRLSDHPSLGRRGRVAGTRELVVVTTPYVVVSSVGRTTVDVLRVLHGSRRWP